MIFDVIKVISNGKFNLQDELELQKQMLQALSVFNPIQSHPLSKADIIDFFIDGIGIEVKIKGGRKAIYKQCERYCKHDEVKALILATNRAIGFPPEINGKPCYVVNLGKGWL